MSRYVSPSAKSRPRNASVQHRQERLEETLREEITEVVGFELEDARISPVDVNAVKISPDSTQARVYVTVHGETPDAVKTTLDALNHAAPYVRRVVSSRLNLRKVPQLHFLDDTTLASALRIEAILAEGDVSDNPESDPNKG